MGFLSGFISPGLTATARAVSGAQEGDVQGSLFKMQQERQRKEDELKALIAGAQVKNLSSEVFARDHPKPTYDSDRGVTVDVTNATSTPVAGVTPKDPIGQATKIHEKERLFDVDHPVPVQADRTLVPVQQADGSVRYTPRDLAAGELAPSPNARGAAAIMKDVAANETQVSVIDDALKELDAHPDAVGLKRGAADLPLVGGVADAINQRVDPNGVAARASLANVSSLVIKDRSGSAVTVSESARLRPFIPSTGDTPEAIRVKLRKLRAAIETETQELRKSGGTGAHTGASAPGGTIDLGKTGKVPSSSQRQRAATDPDYKQFLLEQGYNF